VHRIEAATAGQAAHGARQAYGLESAYVLGRFAEDQTRENFIIGQRRHRGQAQFGLLISAVQLGADLNILSLVNRRYPQYCAVIVETRLPLFQDKAFAEQLQTPAAGGE